MKMKKRRTVGGRSRATHILQQGKRAALLTKFVFAKRFVNYNRSSIKRSVTEPSKGLVRKLAVRVRDRRYTSEKALFHF